MILEHRIVQKRATSVENVIVRSNDELIGSIIFILNAWLNDKSHVAKGEGEVTIENEPVVVYAVESVAFLDVNVGEVETLVSLEFYILEAHHGDLLASEIALVFLKDVRIAKMVPEYLIWALNIKCIFFAIFRYIPYNDTVLL